ncbi:glycosyltransferase family 2 protein [Niallia sp. FSL R7-0271]|uniref:glycosyltransferase family 2 protein n=1 Tax=Niallia sp. FSL R7-0271 TaxID=2921678 RepID=UPI0030F8740C
MNLLFFRPKTKTASDYELFQHPNQTAAPIVTVVTPVYNNDATIKKTIDSVLNQTLGEKIEYILVDDGSTDNTRSILLEYSKKHPNIKLAFLKKNTGTPAYPRNLGIKLAKAPYISFLDADDWFELSGLEKLYNVLKETNDDYIVGKTVKIRTDGTAIVGEHESSTERRNVPPVSIPHIFHHLGPRARMMKTSIIKENGLKFPAMKFAEDKQFFMDVLACCKSISTTKDVIYYLNRQNENKDSLTSRTNVLHKMKCNQKVIRYFKGKELDPVIKKMILNRLYEFDCFTGFINRYHTLRSEKSSVKHKANDYLKRKAYVWTMKKTLRTAKSLDYDISDHFFKPINKACYQLFKNGCYKEMEELTRWHANTKIKNFHFKDDQVFMVSPLAEPYKYIELPAHAELANCTPNTDHISLHLKATGVDAAIQELLLRDRQSAASEFSLPASVDENGEGIIAIPLEWLSALPKSVYNLYLRYNDYQKVQLHIPASIESLKKQQSKNCHFYCTVNQNLALKIK